MSDAFVGQWRHGTLPINRPYFESVEPCRHGYLDHHPCEDAQPRKPRLYSRGVAAFVNGQWVPLDAEPDAMPRRQAKDGGRT